jgi:RNA polymerase sigma factor for flagellar operon FliA
MDSAATDQLHEGTLWRRLRQDQDATARQQLLDLHLPYAKVVAATYFSRRYHDEIEFGDYLQYASIGLLEAMDRYDATRGVQFRTFAARRMHGAILNGLERFTEKQQQIAARQRLCTERLSELKALANDDTAASRDDAQDARHLMRFVSEVGIGLALCWMLDGTALVDRPDAAASLPFYRSAALKQLRDRLLHAVDALPVQERLVIRSHYLQELPFQELATMLGLTKGRISQIHKQALLRLRSMVREDSDWSASF